MNGKHPEAIFIQLHTYCNASCINCPHPFTYKTIHPKGRMNNSTWSKILNDIIEMDYQGQVGFYLHHEPLLDNSLFDKIKDINTLTNAYVVLSTNGALLDKINIEKLIEARPRKVHININSGDKEEFQSSMGLNYPTTIGNIQNFISKTTNLIDIEINCPVMRGYNVDSLKQIFPNTYVNLEYNANSRGGLIPELIDNVKNSRFKLGDYCKQPSQNFNILYDGSVIACCMDWMHESKKDYPNVQHDSILSIYNKTIKLEDNFRKGDYSKYRMCLACSKEMEFDLWPLSKSLKILLTNHHLTDYTGSEIYTLTLARTLKNLGHDVTVYSKYIDKIETEFTSNRIFLTNNLNQIKDTIFDVAHVHHNINAAEIRYTFPELPIVYVSHGVLPFLEQPPTQNSSINSFVAVSKEVRDNLIKIGISEKNINVIHNLIDPQVFTETVPIKSKPENILIISGRIDDEKLNKINKAAETLTIKVKIVGGRFGQVNQIVLAKLIQQSDIVFSLGRGVVETIFAGRIPFVYDYLGGDGLLTPDLYDESIKCNFSGRRFSRDFSMVEIIEELKKYDPKIVPILKQKALLDFSSESNVKKLLGVYKSAISTKIEYFKSKDIENLVLSIKETRNYSYDQGRNQFKRELSRHLDISKMISLSEELINDNKIPEAQSLLEFLKMIHPENLDILNNLSVIKIIQKDYKAAIEIINRILDSDPLNKVARGNLELIEELLNEEINTPKIIEICTSKKSNCDNAKPKNIFDEPNLSIDISILIPVYNNIQLTVNCLKSIKETESSNISYEIIIIDDASEEDVEIEINALNLGQKIKYLRNDINRGFAFSCNKGAQFAIGDTLVFLNNDTIALDGWLEAGYNTLMNNNNIGAVGAKLLYPDNTIQHAGIEFEKRTNHYLPMWPYHIHRNIHTNAEQVNQLKEYPAVTGACLFIKKEIFDSVGGFDENYGMYFEDVDLCFKVSELNKKIVYEPNCTLYHLEGKSSPDQSIIDELNIESSIRFYDKWRFKINQMSNKKIGNSVYWLAPIFNPSGYASEAIGFALGLDNYLDLTIRHQNKHLSDDFIENMPESWKEPLFRMHKIPPKEWNTEIILNNKPIIIQHQPGEAFQQVRESYYNIGRTMFETDKIPSSWVSKCNMMDELWVPSKFNKETFIQAGVDPNKIQIIPAAIDIEIFSDDNIEPIDLPNKSKFNFLSIFEWTNRKGWDVLLQSYFEAFSKNDDVCLYLRTYLLSNYDTDTKEIINEKIEELILNCGFDKETLPHFEILTNQLSLNDLLRLYKSVDAFVLPSRGEGWGRPYMEAMAMGLPVIATNWSGNTEFMNDEIAYMIDVPELVEVKENEITSYIGHKWANPSKDHLIKLFHEIFQNQNEAIKKGRKAKEFIRSNFSLDAVAKIVVKRLKVIAENLARPKTKCHSKNIKWEGDQLSYHSLALVNREICSRLYNGGYNLALQQTPNSLVEKELEKTYNNIKFLCQNKFDRTDITISHQWPPNLNAPKSGRWIIIQPWEFGSAPRNWVKTFNSKVDEIWVPSNYVKRVYIESGVEESKIAVIPNGYSRAKFHPQIEPYELKTKKSFKFLFVGGTIYRKGIDLLLEAYFSSFTQNDDVCLVIKDFGTNSFYNGQTIQDQLKRYLSAENSPTVEYIDKKLTDTELAGIYTACNILIHPYRGEGFGLPILEAMACGIPVVVTKGGSTDDFCNMENSFQINAEKIYFKNKQVDDLVTVNHPWLLEPSLIDLKNKMTFAYDNPQRLKEIGMIGQKFVESNFTWEMTVEKIESRLNALIDKPIYRFVDDKNYNSDQKLLQIFSEIKSSYIDEDFFECLTGIEKLFSEENKSFFQNHNRLKEILIMSGFSALAIQNYSIAEKSFKKLIEIEPKLGEAHFWLGEINFIKYKHEAALKFYKKAIKYGYKIADCKSRIQEINDYYKKIKNERAVLSKSKDSVTFEEAEALVNASDLVGAENLLAKILDNTPNSVEALNDLTVIKIMQNQIEDALEFINKVIELDPQNEIAIENLNYIESQIDQ